ncbi:hypothetical protein V1478_009135 [Vespula squamosa]|uniref:Uncharacterized protein n=1 Tax=Vespula squamosa TaxID=30214 RepID=A0ABD2APN3_VESSQ
MELKLAKDINFVIMDGVHVGENTNFKYFAVNEENKNLPIDEPGIFFLHHHRENQTLKFVSETANEEAKAYIHCV